MDAQEFYWKTTAPLVQAVLQGFNGLQGSQKKITFSGTLLMYGVSGSGKETSMFGANTAQLGGIAARASDHLFSSQIKNRSVRGFVPGLLNGLELDCEGFCVRSVWPCTE